MHSLFERRVKIVCTLGPASHTLVQLTHLIEDGLDVARLNFSHGTHEFHKGLIHNVREASQRTRKNVAILQDLQGPKLRVGKLPKGGIELKAGDTLLLFPEAATHLAYGDEVMVHVLSASGVC